MSILNDDDYFSNVNRQNSGLQDNLFKQLAEHDCKDVVRTCLSSKENLEYCKQNKSRLTEWWNANPSHKREKYPMSFESYTRSCKNEQQKKEREALFARHKEERARFHANSARQDEEDRARLISLRIQISEEIDRSKAKKAQLYEEENVLFDATDRQLKEAYMQFELNMKQVSKKTDIEEARKRYFLQCKQIEEERARLLAHFKQLQKEEEDRYIAVENQMNETIDFLNANYLQRQKDYFHLLEGMEQKFKDEYRMFEQKWNRLKN